MLDACEFVKNEARKMTPCAPQITPRKYHIATTIFIIPVGAFKEVSVGHPLKLTAKALWRASLPS
jgi:hypothetical protein